MGLDIVHTLWVRGQLSKLECLTIKLLQKHGHEVHLWSFDKIDNAPEGTVLRNAAEVLPEESIFTFKGAPVSGIPKGGIGSLSHWSDQFQLKVLYKEGGIYSQLDVACLKPLDFADDYKFVAYGENYIAAFLMKCPKGSLFAGATSAVLNQHVNGSMTEKMDWNFSMQLIGFCLKRTLPEYKKYILPQNHFLDLGCKKTGPFFDATEPSPDQYIIHWSNATVNEHKNEPIPGSYYHKLLQSVDLA